MLVICDTNGYDVDGKDSHYHVQNAKLVLSGLGSWFKGSNTFSLRSPVVDKERMMPAVYFLS